MPHQTASEDAYRPSLVEGQAHRFVVISGCSGGGKSSLLSELERRGFAVFEEAGRQIVKEQLYIGGDALPWVDAGKFIEISIARSIHNMIRAATTERLTFFDRGIVDQIAGFEQPPAHLERAAQRFRYNKHVFVTPPWKEIFRSDAERRHSFDEAAAHYSLQLAAYRRLGYETVELPKYDVPARAQFVLDRLETR